MILAYSGLASSVWWYHVDADVDRFNSSDHRFNYNWTLNTIICSTSGMIKKKNGRWGSFVRKYLFVYKNISICFREKSKFLLFVFNCSCTKTSYFHLSFSLSSEHFDPFDLEHISQSKSCARQCPWSWKRSGFDSIEDINSALPAWINLREAANWQHANHKTRRTSTVWRQ